MMRGQAHARLLALSVLPSRCPCPQDIPNYKFTGLAWLFMGVANSDATLYDDEFQAMKKAYPDQVPPAEPAFHRLNQLGQHNAPGSLPVRVQLLLSHPSLTVKQRASEGPLPSVG